MRVAYVIAAVLLVCGCAASKDGKHPVGAPTQTQSLPGSPSTAASPAVEPFPALPAGSSIVFDRGGFAAGRVYVAAGAQARAVTSGEHAAFTPFASHDAKLIAYGTRPGPIHLTSFQGTEDREVPGTEGCLPGEWLADNQRFLFTCPDIQGEWSVGVATLTGVERRGLTKSPPGSQPFIAPDDAAIAVGEGTTLRVVALSGRVLRVLRGMGEVAGFARWSPDGGRLLYVFSDGAGTSVRVADAMTGRPLTTIVPPVAIKDCFVDWSATGKQVIFGGTSDVPDDIYLADANGSHIHRLTTTGDAGDASWVR